MHIKRLSACDDENTEYFRGAPTSIFCSVCDSVLESSDWIPRNIASRRKLSAFYSADSRLIFSEALKEWIIKHAENRVEFHPVNPENKWWVVEYCPIVEFDFETRRTRFLNKCGLCGQFEEVIGATPVFLKPTADVPPRGFYRTDLEFGTGREKHQLYLFGNSLAEEAESRFKDLDFV